MLKNMLKAVHKMLEGADKAKVECAREVLGEVIEHLEARIPKGAVYHEDDDLDPDAQLAREELS